HCLIHRRAIRAHSAPSPNPQPAAPISRSSTQFAQHPHHPPTQRNITQKENEATVPAPKPLRRVPNAVFAAPRHCFFDETKPNSPAPPASSFKSSSLHVSNRATRFFVIRISSLIRISGFEFRHSHRGSFR